MEIKIKNTVNLEDLELLYNQLERAGDVNAVVDLSLPLEFHNDFVGLGPAIVQFIISWTRYPKPGKLISVGLSAMEIILSQYFQRY